MMLIHCPVAPILQTSKAVFNFLDAIIIFEFSFLLPPTEKNAVCGKIAQ